LEAVDAFLTLRSRTDDMLLAAGFIKNTGRSPTAITHLTFLSVLLLALPGLAAAQGACQGESRMFDFAIGEWDVLNRNQPADDPGWYETGTATSLVYPVVAGCGIVEHWRGHTFGDFLVGFTLRAFNPQIGQWEMVLLWPNTGEPRFGKMTGGFRHNRGEFYSRSLSPEGDTILTQLTFSDITSESLRWQEARSPDNGRTWSSSWIMEYTRREPIYQGPLLNGPALTTLRCPGPEYRTMDFLIGEWGGAVEADSVEAEGMGVRAEIAPILEGCGIMERVSAIGQGSAWEVFRVRAFEPARNRWVEYRLDTRWPILQRLEAEVPPAGAPWVFQTPGAEPLDGALRVTMNRGMDGSVTWDEERYDGEAAAWVANPAVGLTERLGPAPRSGDAVPGGG
jgi:hypothetical protein